jgi:ABC-2 type transport system permease protein
MLSVFLLQFKRLIKEPFMVLTFFGLSIVFVYFMIGSVGSSNVNVSVYTEELSQEETEEWLDRLNEEGNFEFQEAEEERVTEELRMNQIPFAIELQENQYRIHVGRENELLPVVEQHVEMVYQESFRIQEVEEIVDEEVTVSPILSTNSRLLNDEPGTQVDETMQAINVYMVFGMTFYFTMFSIMFLMIQLIQEKKLGTWDRMVFSPLSKTSVYLGHLFFYMTVGVGQIALALLLFQAILSIQFTGSILAMSIVILAFVFTIVSLGILLIAFAQNAQALQVIIPLVSTSMAMIGGAFWPLEIVTNNVLLTLAEFMPLKHGIQGMLDVVVRQVSLTELLYPVGCLVLMGILFMGIGLNRLERPAEA